MKQKYQSSRRRKKRGQSLWIRSQVETFSGKKEPSQREIMGAIELELRCPKNVNGIAADPQPDWSFDNLLSELDSINQRQNVALDFPVPFTKTQPTYVFNPSCEFVSMPEEADNYSMVSGRRFACDELYMSGDSDGCHLKDKMGLAEGGSEIKISSLETQLVYENDSCASLTTKMDRHRDLQQERERKFDLQYQRTIAEALDNHLTAVQRDHEHISQLEERKIRDDAAREEAKRKEKAFQEEKLRQERIKVEEEARLKAEMAERAKAAAIEAEKQAAEEAASKRATETLRDTAQNAVQDSKATIGPSNYNKHGQNIGRQIKTISATVENVRTRAEELVKLIVSNCTNQRSFSAIFAISRVIVLVTSKEAYKTKDTYFKAIGYEEDNGKIESIDDYVGRLSCYMKLYGALVQTEVGGFQNLHGLTEGWAWLARFLNALPANLYTAVAAFFS
ncbi:hypothetical protein DH2020_027064 [Rehmannia glutinosa]|uniref:mRNA export factor GLE1 n=1 Tax=Rehmannia glutinosa TaxID=99300 RepID=A0ABR0VY20_REHGL